MSRAEVRYRRPLNDEQLAVLKLLYCYRFGTCKYVAQYLGKKDIKVVQKKLKILEEQAYVSKRYEKSYKLRGRPAEYYLTPKGARLLMRRTDPRAKSVDKVTEQGIKNLYKNATVSPDYVSHCLQILSASLHLSQLYGERLQCFARMQMIPFSYLPTWRPDVFLSLKTGAKGKGTPKRFFLDVWDGTRPFFVSVRKVRSYITYAEEGDWPTDEVDLPIVLMICDSDLNEKKLRRQINKALDDSYEEVSFATTTMDTFMEASEGKDKVWRMADDNEEVLRLANISVNT